MSEAAQSDDTPAYWETCKVARAEKKKAAAAVEAAREESCCCSEESCCCIEGNVCKGVENRDVYAINASINDQVEFCQYTRENHLELLLLIASGRRDDHGDTYMGLNGSQECLI
jgi:hypothetical protein